MPSKSSSSDKQDCVTFAVMFPKANEIKPYAAVTSVTFSRNVKLPVCAHIFYHNQRTCSWLSNRNRYK